MSKKVVYRVGDRLIWVNQRGNRNGGTYPLFIEGVVESRGTISIVLRLDEPLHFKNWRDEDASQERVYVSRIDECYPPECREAIEAWAVKEQRLINAEAKCAEQLAEAQQRIYEENHLSELTIDRDGDLRALYALNPYHWSNR